MAPKRSVKISAPAKKIQSVPEKLTRGRSKKAKPSKVSGVITISVPVIENGSGILSTEQKFKVDIETPMLIEDAKAQLLKSSVERKMQNITPALRRGRSKTETVAELNCVESESTTVVKSVLDTERKVDLKTKVALANEVARSQLLKEPIEARVNTTPPVPKKINRRSKQQIISEFFSKENNTAMLKQNLKGKKPLVNSKKITNKTASDMKTVATKKRKADSTEEKPTAKRRNDTKAIKKEHNELKVESSVENKTTKDDITKADDKQAVKAFNPPMVVIPMKKRRLWRGKKKNDVTETKTSNFYNESSNSPSSEANNCKSPILQTSNTKTTPIKNKTDASVRPNSRQTSSCSVSDLSWTHDISSSSTTTCVTVSSKDFVCFNNKIPVVKLRNIQSLVNKTQVSNEGRTEINEDISSSDMETSCDKPASLIDSNSLIKSNPLNLSLSSNDSSKKQVKDDKIKLNKKDYTQAAKNLEHALEKIDMEFINWIPESEYVSLEFNKIKDKLFHILRSEFRALTHCKILREISTNFNPNCNYDQNKSEIATESVNENSFVRNNGIKNKIPHDANIQTKEIETDNPNAQTNEIDENKIESEEEFPKLKPFERDTDKFPNKDSLSCSEDSSSGSENLLANNEVKSPHNPQDDDDALSLFAESITGIESSKLNTSIASVPKRMEEYIPEPIQNKPNYSYCPTKIADVKTATTKTVCEKQNADSTSIYREADNITPVFNESVSYSDNCQETDVNISPNHNKNDNIFYTDDTNIMHLYKDFANSPDSDKTVVDKVAVDKKSLPAERFLKRPYLIADVYKLKPKRKQIIFEGLCYFNLLGTCLNTKKNKMCMFSHRIPDENEITKTLSMLNNGLFITEYMLSRRNEKILNNYGLCFVKLCVERKLTRILVEMALDFIRATYIDESLKVTVVEMTLMYLNNVDLYECEDLLKINVPNGTMLCEIFMQIMTNSQNFSRFKPVFLSLTYFMVNNDRTFSLEVAEQILERVCILPFDESLVRALLQIMRLTNREIFLNSMIVQFEKQISVNSDILAEYGSLKKDINFGNMGRWVENRPLLSAVPMGSGHTSTQQMYQPISRPTLMASEEQPLSEIREGVPLPPSPDTTHLEILNKTSEDTTVPKITRTISGLSSSQFSPSVLFNTTTNSEEVLPSPNFQNWRNQSILQRFVGQRRSMRPPLRLRTSTHRKSTRWHDHRYVTLGMSPTKYLPPEAKY